MAKNKKQQIQAKAPRKRASRIRQARGMSPQQAYAMLLKQPEYAGVPNTGVYDGELGIFNRFVSSIALNAVAGQTAGFLGFIPGTGNGFFGSASTSTGTPSWAYTNVGFPGASFLTTNASKVRGVSCRIELIPSAASANNITGDCAVGVTTPSAFLSGVTTPDQLFDLAKANVPLERKVVAVSWYPGSLDHTYNAYNLAPSADDSNAVYVAYRGWPAGTVITARITYVVEWTPKTNLGLPASGAVSTPVGHASVVAELHKQDPHWHHSLLDEVKGVGLGIAKDFGMATRYMARQGMSKLASGLMKAAPGALALV